MHDLGQVGWLGDGEPDFRGFQKIARLNRLCIASEKIDGTNGVICVSEDRSQIRAGSKNRWLTTDPKDDTFSFARWVDAHSEELRTGLGPGYHYGEWWGQGIQRKYGLKEKRFSLFNVHRWADDAVRPKCCHVVPELARGTDIRIVTEIALDTLRLTGSVAVPGFPNPEGIVIFHTAGSHLFKVTLRGDDAPKGAA